MWAVVEGRGRRPSHTFLDYCISYLLTAVVVAFTAGQIGSPSQGYPNIATQMGQSNAPLAAFALLGGVSAAVGDLCMLFSVALLGLAVGPASINAIGIVAGSPPLATSASSPTSNCYLCGAGPAIMRRLVKWEPM